MNDKSLTKSRKQLKEKIDFKKFYKVEDAIVLLKDFSTENFDTSFRVSFHLNLDTRQVDQQLRGVLVLPHGVGKKKRILAIVEEERLKEVKSMGVDFVGADSMIEKVFKGWTDFDIVVTTPTMMPKMSKLGKILGPKGMMPNPKLGTITNDLAKIIDNLKKGQIEYRADKDGNVNLSFGKKSFSNKQLVDNFNEIYERLISIKPNTVKGVYIKNLVISTTMGPGLKIQIKT